FRRTCVRTTSQVTFVLADVRWCPATGTRIRVRRRMTAGRAMPAGSSRVLRLDPAALPVNVAMNDARAHERLRLVELGRERVVVRRAVRGIPMRVSLPVSEFLGVAIRVIPPDESYEGAVAVMLEHRDQGLSVPLMVATDGDGDVVAEWQ